MTPVPHLLLFSKCVVMNKPFTSTSIYSAGFQVQKIKRSENYNK